MKSCVLSHHLEFADVTLTVAVSDSLRLAAQAASKSRGTEVNVPKRPGRAWFIEDSAGYVVLLSYAVLDIPTIVHELTHVTVAALKHLGVKLSSKSEEAYCRHLDMLTELVMKWVSDHGLPWVPYEGYTPPKSPVQPVP